MNLRGKRGQTSLEFMFLVGFMFVIFAIFFVIIQQRTIEVAAQRDYVSLKEINSIVKNEVRNAQVFEDGYSKSFYIHPLIYGRRYVVNISEDRSELYFNLSTVEYLDFLDNATYGNITTGMNSICKKEGYVHINNCTGPLYILT
ncbi:MAG: hypothetical protein ABIJ21_04835 [Nanoarchaeota archaeon]